MKNNNKVTEFSHLLKKNDLDSCDTLLEKDLYNEALQCFNVTLEDDPDNMFALMGKAYSLSKLKKHDDAIETMNNCIRKEPKNEIGRYLKAEIMKESGNHDIALKLYELLLKSKPHDEEYLIGKAESLKLLGRVDEAEAIFEEFLDLEETSTEIEGTEIECPDCSILITVGSDCPICDYKAPTEVEEAPEPVDEVAPENIAEEIQETVDETTIEPDIISEPRVEEPDKEPKAKEIVPTADEMLCPACDGIMKAESAICPYCSLETEHLHACPSCCIGIDKMAYICPYCYTYISIISAEFEEPIHYTEEDTPEKKAARKEFYTEGYKKKRMSVSLMGVFCIFTLSVYLIYTSVLPVYDNLFVIVNLSELIPGLLFMGLGFGALYGGFTVARNSLVFDHFTDSIFETEVYPRLEPALEEVIEVQARLDNIDQQMDRMSLNIARQKNHPVIEESPFRSISSKIAMFLKFVVIINLTIGILLYALSFPGRFAPYIFTTIFMLWWLVISDEYGLWKVPVAWGWAIFPIITVPVMAILLYYVIPIGSLIGLIGLFLVIYSYSYFAWARYYVEGILPFGLHEAELQPEE